MYDKIKFKTLQYLKILRPMQSFEKDLMPSKLGESKTNLRPCDVYMIDNNTFTGKFSQFRSTKGIIYMGSVLQFRSFSFYNAAR